MITGVLLRAYSYIGFLFFVIPLFMVSLFFFPPGVFLSDRRRSSFICCTLPDGTHNIGTLLFVTQFVQHEGSSALITQKHSSERKKSYNGNQNVFFFSFFLLSKKENTSAIYIYHITVCYFFLPIGGYFQLCKLRDIPWFACFCIFLAMDYWPVTPPPLDVTTGSTRR